MLDNFRTLISAILTKVSAIHPKKSDVYTKTEVDNEIAKLKNNDVGYITADDIPTDVSQLNNDVGYITADDIPESFSGSWNDLTDKPCGISYEYSKVLYSVQLTLPTPDADGWCSYNVSKQNLGISSTTSYKIIVRTSTLAGNAIETEGLTAQFSAGGGGTYTLTLGDKEKDSVYLTYSNNMSLTIYYKPTWKTQIEDIIVYEGVEIFSPLDEKYIPETIARTEDIPTDVSQLNNDAGYITVEDIPDSASPAIIDVLELPTEDIQENVFYRVPVATLYDGETYYSDMITVRVVRSLPDIGEPYVVYDTGRNYNHYNVYYDINNESLYAYSTEEMISEYGIYDTVGWHSGNAIIYHELGCEFVGVVYDKNDIIDDCNVRLLIEYRLYHYNNGWIENTPVGFNGSGIYSTVFNSFTNTASGNYSHAEGSITTASSWCSHAEGYRTTASGDFSHAEGYLTTASGDYSHAEGEGTTASGNCSHAEGAGTTASGNCSHAEGYLTTASGCSQHVQGEYNIVEENDAPYSRGKYAHIVGNGTDYNKRSNAHTLDWSGNAWFAGTVYVGGTSQDDPNAKELATKEYVDSHSGSGEGGVLPYYVDVKIQGGKYVLVSFSWSEVIMQITSKNTVWCRITDVDAVMYLPLISKVVAEYESFIVFSAINENWYYEVKIYPDGTVFVTNEPVADIDASLTREGASADAKAVGDALKETVKTVNGIEPDENGNVEIEIAEPEDTTLTDAQASAKLGNELLTASGWTTTGWTGSLAEGFTHTSGNTNSLKFAMPSGITGKRYQISFACSTEITTANLKVRIGNSELFELYGQFGVDVQGGVGITAVDDSPLEFVPSSTFTGRIYNISAKEITDISEPYFEVKDGTGNTAFQARFSDPERDNVFFGTNAGRMNTSGKMNFGLGFNALRDNTSGFWNTAIGARALEGNDVGSRNIGIGYVSLLRNHTGHRNIAIGTYSMQNNTTGHHNISIGADSLDGNVTGSGNVGIGFGALYENQIGDENVAIGFAAAHATANPDKSVKINGNTAVGAYALMSTKAGAEITAIGYNALKNDISQGNNTAVGAAAGAKNTTGIRNTYIGKAADATDTWFNDCIAIGYGAKASKSGQSVIGGTNTTETVVKGNFIVQGTDGVKRQIVFNADGTCSWTTV